MYDYRSEFYDTQLNNFRRKLNETKPQLLSPDQDLLAKFDYSQKCLDSLAFLKQIDTSYQSISDLYYKVS